MPGYWVKRLDEIPLVSEDEPGDPLWYPLQHHFGFTAFGVNVYTAPEETPAQAAERRRGYLQSLGLPEDSDAWSFWVDQGGAAKRLADAVGFHYKKDEASGEWAHLAALVVLAPDGRVSRYLYGIEFPGKDFRLSLVETEWVRRVVLAEAA